ncbi:MAG: glycosyltransferase family 4 protein [bacterium]|nr:glycosyltransferase family 4 protein [bacterium]
MKIAQIVSSFPPYYGGMGNVVFQMSAELKRRGHEVVVYTPQYFEDKEIKNIDEEPEDEHSEELENQIEDVKRLRPSFQYGNAARLPQLYEELQGFDIVHMHYPFFGTASIIKKWKKKHPKIPLVVTYHMDPRGLGWKGLIFKMYSKYYSSRVLDSADIILASSYDYVESSEAKESLNKFPEKWIELPFGVDSERFAPRDIPVELMEAFNLRSDIPIVLFVGGMDRAHYFKGIPILLEALLILKKQKTPIQALLVGDGELRQEFETGVKTYGLSEYVKFAGHVSNEDLPFYYNLADILVLPSIHQGEAFGMVLLEAMASGVPVIASNLPGVRTVAEDGGRIFETSNARDLAESIYGFFINDEENQAMWREKVREIVEKKYSWLIIVDKLEGIYDGLVTRNT